MIKAVFNDIEMMKFSFENLLRKAIFCENIANNCIFANMSDSIVISITQNDADLAFSLFFYSKYANKIAKSNALARGDISKDEFFKLDNLTFRSALIKAYCLEKKTSIYPRIIIDTIIIDALTERKIIKTNRIMGRLYRYKKSAFGEF